MNRWSSRSKRNLESCDTDLQVLFERVLRRMDCSVICGHRKEYEQNILYPRYTQLRFPNSMHNRIPALAVDVIPYVKGVDIYKRPGLFYKLACIVFEEAMLMGLNVAWGGNWTSPVDMAHWELA